MSNGTPITAIETNDTARILDNAEAEWTSGFLKVYKRTKTKTLASGQVFYCEPYQTFTLLVSLDAPAWPNYIQIAVQLSNDGVTWYNLADGPFASLVWGGNLGAVKDALHGVLDAQFFRYVNVVGTATVKAIFVT